MGRNCFLSALEDDVNLSSFVALSFLFALLSLIRLV